MKKRNFLGSAWASMVMAAFSASAFALTPGSGTWVAEPNTFGMKDVYVYVPKNAAPNVIGKGRALMLNLHGCGQTASGNMINKKFNWDETAEAYGMVVVTPTVPGDNNGGSRSYAGCWDWFGGTHTRTTRDEGRLLQLINALKQRTSLDIDPTQVYVSGLSSGAGVTGWIACVAPDVFAGVGSNAGPLVGTSKDGLPGSKPTITAQSSADLCKQIAGNYKGDFATQIYSVVNGTGDSMVDPSHDKATVAAMQIVYGASTPNGTFTDVKTTGELWKDAAGKTRISYAQATGMAHAWPAGAGGSGGGQYVDYTHINYPAYLTKFLFDNNMRVCRDQALCPNDPPASTTTTTSTTHTTEIGTTTTTTTTTTAPPPVADCYTASNVAHVAAGRAYYSFGYTRAYGSYAQMGAYNSSTITSLIKKGAYNYVLGSCR